MCGDENKPKFQKILLHENIHIWCKKKEIKFLDEKDKENFVKRCTNLLFNE